MTAPEGVEGERGKPLLASADAKPSASKAQYYYGRKNPQGKEDEPACSAKLSPMPRTGCSSSMPSKPSAQ
nr:MAG TPA: hypothetical protein [Caudoviricetes sp.]